MSSYAGIGSRETPLYVTSIFESIGEFLAKKGWVLRSGHAKGADQAFERGCDNAHGAKEIYLPWFGFEGSGSNLVLKDPHAAQIAMSFHPGWSNLSIGARMLQARNSHQILGKLLDDPVLFVVCWTEKGMGSGGTGQALRIAKYYDIPVFDAGKLEEIGETKDAFNQFYLEHRKGWDKCREYGSAQDVVRI